MAGSSPAMTGEARAKRPEPRMRPLALWVLVALAGCSGSPQSLGITGPGAAPQPPSADSDSTIGAPGVPSDAVRGPSVQPTTGSGLYYNYN
jgi:hypothetical protein